MKKFFTEKSYLIPNIKRKTIVKTIIKASAINKILFSLSDFKSADGI